MRKSSSNQRRLNIRIFEAPSVVNTSFYSVEIHAVDIQDHVLPEVLFLEVIKLRVNRLKLLVHQIHEVRVGKLPNEVLLQHVELGFDCCGYLLKEGISKTIEELFL